MVPPTNDGTGYQLVDPGYDGGARDLTRGEAKRAFQRVLDTKNERIRMLGELSRLPGGPVLQTSDARVQDLNDWFVANVEPDPARPGVVGDVWRSIAHDVGLFLGDVMIERHPELRWELFVWGRRNVCYHRPVVMGFAAEDPRFRTNCDITRMVLGYAHEIIESRGSIPSHGKVTVRGVEIDLDVSADRFRARELETDAFWRWLLIADRRSDEYGSLSS